MRVNIQRKHLISRGLLPLATFFLVCTSRAVCCQNSPNVPVADTHSAAGHETTPADPLSANLRQYVNQNDLDLSGTAPWYLKAAFHRFDPNGHPIEEGTFEQWWLSSTSWRLEVHTNGRDLTFVRDHGKTYSRAKDDLLPVAVEWLQPQFVEAIPEAFFLNSKADFGKRTFGSLTLNCVNLTRNGKDSVTRSYFPYKNTLCFDPQNRLRAVSIEDGVINIARNRMGTFLGHSVATQIDASDRSGKLFSGEIAELKTIPVSAIDLSTAKLVESSIASDFFDDTQDRSIRKALSKPSPHYPESARYEHLGGIVFLRAIIAEDGHVESVETISAPSTDLARSSKDAAEHWLYEPANINGQPSKQETIFTMRYSLNGTP